MAKKNVPDEERETGVTWEVRANCRQFHQQLRRKSFLFVHWGKYADNAVRSYKYSPLTFLPLNLYEQFQRAANLYFLLIVIMQCVPAISTLRWYTTMLPLLVVLTMRGLKDLLTDLGRRRSDSQINRRPCDILTTQGFRTAQWKDVCVGDILRIHKDQIIPADLLLLCSTEPHSLCYVETADIDGETNLKFRQALSITHTELTSGPIDAELQLQMFDGIVLCEEPNSRLYSFRGELHWRGESHLLEADHILLRGTTLRNTDTAYGLALYTGSDSKVLRNCGRLRVKRTQVEKILNRVVLGIVLFVLMVALLLAIGAGVFEHNVSPRIEVLSALRGDFTPVYTGFLAFWGYVILLSPSMPMTLYITFEVMRMIHCFMIGWDLEMYWAETDSPAHARTTSLNEELGQVGHLLSDKTGTLTQNKLLFRQCCIAGCIYGDTSVTGEKTKPLDLSWNPFSCGDLLFSDQRLVDRLREKGCAQTREFFTALALCHTVMSERKDGSLRYQAASPDEGALVSAARELGWVFLTRTRDSMTLNELGHTRQYQLLALLDFTSKRRRMSVLVREPEGGLKLYCKGADIVILERLQNNCPDLESTENALELFAQGCLRTLCVAVRSVTEELWREWSHGLKQAAKATAQREKMLEDVYGRMETELTLLGVTAIEDRLQDGVPETIASLRRAGIKVWVLTGDKTETAVNVGYSCKLMDPDTRLLQGDELKQLLQDSSPDIAFLKTVDSDVWSTHRETGGRKTALVITGHELAELTAKPETGAKLIALSDQCQSVLCCRVTPGQKAEVIHLIRKHSPSVTMAIGDGANDVNMIKTAHIGVGLYGVEGSQAVQNADFAVAQFSFLRRLLLVHGHWSYLRICLFLRYFLYKTTAFALVHVWYSFYNGFSAQSVYENWFIALYTSMYTTFPIQCLAIFEQDVSAEGCVCWPEVYTVGQRHKLLNPLVLSATLLYSFYTSVILIFFPLGVFQYASLDYQTFAVTVATSAVFTTTVEIVLYTKFWTKWNIIAIFVSLGCYFLITLITQSPRLFQSAPTDYYFPGVAPNAFSNPVFWLTVLITTCAAILPSVTVRALGLVLANPDKHKVHNSYGSQGTDSPKLQSWFKRDTPRRRSSYAMSQGKGFGQLLTSGAGLHNRAPPKDRRVTTDNLTTPL